MWNLQPPSFRIFKYPTAKSHALFWSSGSVCVCGGGEKLLYLLQTVYATADLHSLPITQKFIKWQLYQILLKKENNLKKTTKVQ